MVGVTHRARPCTARVHTPRNLESTRIQSHPNISDAHALTNLFHDSHIFTRRMVNHVVSSHKLRILVTLYQIISPMGFNLVSVSEVA